MERKYANGGLKVSAIVRCDLAVVQRAPGRTRRDDGPKKRSFSATVSILRGGSAMGPGAAVPQTRLGHQIESRSLRRFHAPRYNGRNARSRPRRPVAIPLTATAPNPAQLFTQRTNSYTRFIRLVRYQEGLRSYFRRSPLLRSGLRVLDAGCGTGALTLALREALLERGLPPDLMHGFDLTPAMLDSFRHRLDVQGINGVELVQCDVLRLGALPAAWNNYDLVVSASMLEYVPREHFVTALSGLRGLLRTDGRFVLFITKNNWLMRPLIGRWWDSHLYNAAELTQALREAWFRDAKFGAFPFWFRHLSPWGHIVEAVPDSR
jgi:ubiquinone/menaquinone biosynthesis C-methylase UbiE